MMKQFKNIFTGAFVALALIATMGTGTALAATSLGSACEDLKTKDKPNGDSVICEQQANAQAKTNTLLADIVSTLMFVLGGISVIMIVIGGIRYATSGGDASQTKSAKDTILYSVVGLVVAIFAYAIVNFVLSRV